MAYKEDILEKSFHLGVSQTANLFKITEEEVWKIRSEFEDEMYFRCACEAARDSGMMCFACDNQKVLKVPK